jgi:hypothetical protein
MAGGDNMYHQTTPPRPDTNVFDIPNIYVNYQWKEWDGRQTRLGSFSTLLRVPVCIIKSFFAISVNKAQP